jgi:hypothetical protein
MDPATEEEWAELRTACEGLGEDDQRRVADDWIRRRGRRSFNTAMASVSIPVDRRGYDQWEAQRERAQMSRSGCLEFAEWWPDDVLVHSASYDGALTGLVVRRHNLVGIDCGITATWTVHQAEVDEAVKERWGHLADDERRAELQLIRDVRQIILNAGARRWRDGAPPPPTPSVPPTPEQRRAKRLAKLRAEAAKLGVTINEGSD